MKIELIISENGKHIFTTQSRDCSFKTIGDFLGLFRKKFPKREGFDVGVMLDLEEKEHFESIDLFARKRILSAEEE